MDHVLAQVQITGGYQPYKLLSDTALFDTEHIPDELQITYDPNYKLEDEEWFKIDSFSRQEFSCQEPSRSFFTAEYDAKNYNNCAKKDFCEIKYLCSVQGNDFYFQKITDAKFIKKKMLFFGEMAERAPEGYYLAINHEPDAIYIKKQDILLFKKLSTIKELFPGIDQLYREATQAEVEGFCQHEFFEITYASDKIGVANRKRIALAQEQLTVIARDNGEKLIAYIKRYNEAHFQFDPQSGALKITTEGELTQLLFAIGERFHTTELTSEKRVANSVRLLTQIAE